MSHSTPLQQLTVSYGAGSALVDAPKPPAGPGGPLTLYGDGISHPRDLDGVKRDNPCDAWRTMRGTCVHGAERWVYVRCKKRTCDGCAKVRQWQFSSRIANGIRQYGVDNSRVGIRYQAALIVCTYAEPEAADPAFKVTAVRRENGFIKWLRVEQKKLGNPDMQYAKTWEIQPGTGRLHTNIIVGPWVHMPNGHAKVYARWGARISLNWVHDDRQVAAEATKARSPDGLSTYLTKIEQMVPAAWHRAISFSKGWPKLAADPPERVGEIVWTPESMIEPGEIARFQLGQISGWWAEEREGSGEFIDQLHPEWCRCFDFKPPEPLTVNTATPIIPGGV